MHQVALLEAGRRRIALAVQTAANPSHDYGVRTLEGIRGATGTSHRQLVTEPSAGSLRGPHTLDLAEKRI